MDYEFELTLKNGRTVNVVGCADVLNSCDCGGNFHPHIQDLGIDSAVLIVNDGEDSFLEVDICEELETAVENRIYSELEEACA